MSAQRDVVPSVKPDSPAAEDFLGFTPYAETLFSLIHDETTRTPLTIGIFGSWGSGKTSLMTMIKRRLDDLRRQEKRQARKGEIVRAHLPVWFNAWLYSSEESLGRALILRVLAELRREVGRDREARSALDKMEADLYRTAAPESLGELSIGSQALVSGSGEEAQFRLPLTTGLSLLSAIAQARAEAADEDAAQAAASALAQSVEQMRTALDRERVEALEVFRQDFQKLVKRFVSPGVLVVFVDDLDRCLPDKAIEVLEAIKLFFDIEGCIFVLGIDQDVIQRGIRLKYRDYEQLEDGGPPPISGAKYLEKIVQIPFHLPLIDPDAMVRYIARTAPRLSEIDRRCADVFAEGMEPNPRRVKRTLNIFFFLWRLSRHLGGLRDRIKPVRLAKMVVIQQHHEDLFEALPDDPELLIQLEQAFRQAGLEGAPPPCDRLQPFLVRESLREMLTRQEEGEQDVNFADLPAPDVLEYVHLSQSSSKGWLARKLRRLDRKLRGLPFVPPLILIPGGEFLMGVSEDDVDLLAVLFEGQDQEAVRASLEAAMPQHALYLPDFYIGQYPVTNAEYAEFVRDRAGEVEPPEHWKGDESPESLRDHPVVKVTWHDAMAYCAWLTDKTGATFRLPTEAEWEKAASWDPQTTAKRLFPWGSEWDASRCNSKTSPREGAAGTTPVGRYRPAGGDSAYGVGDMMGNVFEWSLSKWESQRDAAAPFGYPYDSSDGRDDVEGEASRVLRGGSFNSELGWCHASARLADDPRSRYDYVGLRIVRTLE